VPLLVHALIWLTTPPDPDAERGDVPGWVMITVMTAALVVAILVPFRTAIVQAVQAALDSVISSA